MKKLFAGFTIAVLLGATLRAAETNAPANASGNDALRLLQPLSLADALDVALLQNSAIRKSSADLEAAYGMYQQRWGNRIHPPLKSIAAPGDWGEPM